MTSEKVKKVKKKGPLRIEAIIPLAVIVLCLYLYGKFALDNNLRQALIFGAEQVHGAEVNLKSLRLKIFEGSLTLKGLQVTDKSEPQKNLFQVDEFTFALDTYELLKAKFIVDLSKIGGIKWGVPRKKAGMIYPASQTKSEELEKLEQSAIATAKEEFQGNVLGNAANIIGGKKAKDEIKDIKKELITEQKIKEIEAEVKEKEEYYKQRLSSLKGDNEIKSVKERAENYKWNKSNPIKSLKEINDIVKDANSVVKRYKSDLQNLKADAKKIENIGTNVDKWIEQDMQNLQSMAGVPELNPESLAYSLFGNYFGENVAKFRKYSEVAKEYMPPPKSERKKTGLIPPKRGEGKNYNFPRVGENPKLWIKKVEISSQAGKSEYGGNLSGTITDITTSPKIINKPVAVDIKGDFPKQRIMGIHLQGTIDHREALARQRINLKIQEVPFKRKKLSDSKDLKLALKEAPGSLNLEASKEGDKALVELNAIMLKPQFDIEADKKLVREIMSNILNTMPELTLRARAEGKWEELKWNFRSNLGTALSDGLKKEMGARVADAKKKLREKIESKVGPKKKELQAKIINFKNTFDKEIKDKENKAGDELKSILAKIQGKKGESPQKKIEEKAKKLLKKLF